ncbi:hypothetical protein SNEBB_000440 [Seison nebaliae]|nr:hypothetical protein SNEBB_000440 [Seison nebaliae]
MLCQWIGSEGNTERQFGHLPSRNEIKIDQQCLQLLHTFINEQFNAIYTFTSLSNYYASETQSLSAISELFNNATSIEFLNNRKLHMEIFNRGSTVLLKNIYPPHLDNRWGSSVKSSLTTKLNIHIGLSKMATNLIRNCGTNDPSLAHFLNNNILETELQLVHEMASIINRVTKPNSSEEETNSQLEKYFTSLSS